MPKSKHRKKPFRTRVQKRQRSEQLDKQAEARQKIYDKALPQFQECPPMLLRDLKSKPSKVVKAEGSHVARLHTSESERAFQTLDKRQYEFQRDGSLRVLNKPRSRVRRLREERANQTEVKEQKLAA